MSKSYAPVPDLTAGLPKVERKKELFDWLRQNCEWREGEWCDTQPIYEAYGQWERAKYGIPVAPRSIVQSLVSLGYLFQGSKVLGVFLRSPEAVPVERKPMDEQSLRGGSAALVNPDLYVGNGIPMELPKKPEVTFIENGPQPRNKLIQDATGKWIVEHGPMPPAKKA